MIHTITALASLIIGIILYLYHFKNAEIQIAFINGFLVGVSLDSPEIDGFKSHYLDLYLGVVLVAVIWDE
jgi:hypothetical protein